MAERSFLPKMLDYVANTLSRILGTALIIAVILDVVNVVGRYGFNNSLIGADELQIYLMVGMAFLGGPVALIRRRHLRMDVLTRHFPAALVQLLNGAEGLLGIAVCGLMSWVSWTYTIRIFRIGIQSQNAHIAMWIPHSVLALSFTLMTLAGVVRLASPGETRAVEQAEPAAS
jgi:TRAP-type C4-dicarboxylate transport system permease small subunit